MTELLRSNCSLIIVLICEIPTFTKSALAYELVNRFKKANQICKSVICSFYILLEFSKNIEPIVHNRCFKMGAFIWTHCISMLSYFWKVKSKISRQLKTTLNCSVIYKFYRVCFLYFILLNKYWNGETVVYSKKSSLNKIYTFQLQMHILNGNVQIPK